MSAELVAQTREIGDYRRLHPGVQCAACLEAPEIVVQTEIASSARKGSPLAVLCVGISRFSDLLDSMGRSSAEQLLQYVHHLLAQCVGHRGMVLRISEDRFLALLGGLDTAAVTEVASDILQLFWRAHEIAGCRTAISANIGVAMYPKDGSDGSSLITSAKVALKHAKARECIDNDPLDPNHEPPRKTEARPKQSNGALGPIIQHAWVPHCAYPEITDNSQVNVRVIDRTT